MANINITVSISANSNEKNNETLNTITTTINTDINNNTSNQLAKEQKPKENDFNQIINEQEEKSVLITFTENSNENETLNQESTDDSTSLESTYENEKYDDVATEHNSEESDNALECASLSSDSSFSTSTPERSLDTTEELNQLNTLGFSDDEDTSSIDDERKDYSPILVTGGAGFIGSHVANVLLKRGEQVIIIDEVNNYYDVNLKYENLNLLKNRYDTDRLRIYQGDICDNDFIEEIFRNEKPTRIVHLAARAGVRPSIEDPQIYIHSNIKATTILLELARRYSCTSFVFASSSSVYGDSDKSEFSETDNVDFPSSPYAATKKACELMAYTYHHLYGLNCAGLRFFTVYGPRGRPDMAPFKFIDRISRGLTIQQFGNGSSSRDYTYIDDIVDGVIRSLDRPMGYQIYNLGNGHPIELRRFIEIVEKYVGNKAIIEELPDQPGDVPRTCANISKAQKLLDYQPKTDFEKGIRLTVEWYKEYYSRKC